MSIGRESEQISLTTQKSRLIWILGQRRLWNSQAEYQYSNLIFKIDEKRERWDHSDLSEQQKLLIEMLSAPALFASTWTAFKFQRRRKRSVKVLRTPINNSFSWLRHIWIRLLSRIEIVYFPIKLPAFDISAQVFSDKFNYIHMSEHVF